jgi:hypothetical protein
MREPEKIVVPLADEPQLAARALWMLGVSVMVGVVLVASLATAAIAVRAAA